MTSTMGVSYKVKLEKYISMIEKQKKQYINDMSTQFDKSEAVIVTHYQN